jgi:hypothetical protein
MIYVINNRSRLKNEMIFVILLDDASHTDSIDLDLRLSFIYFINDFLNENFCLQHPFV